jgi:hypothetical protein
MGDTTGMEHNRFGMPVNQSADVHALRKPNRNVREAHTVDGDLEARRTVVTFKIWEKRALCSSRKL